MATPTNAASVKLLLHHGKEPHVRTETLFDGVARSWVSGEAVATESPSAAVRIIEVTEYADLALELVSDDPELTVDVTWEQIAWLDGEESSAPIRLERARPYAVLFEYAEQREYPWRCGIYQYEVRIGDASYTGFYEVLPKNVDKEKLAAMHSLINSYVQGIIYDLLGTKKVGGESSSDLDQVVYWKYFMWYKTREQLLLNGVRHIENNGDQRLESTYRVESVPRRQTVKSVRWQQSAGGARHGHSKYLNRVMTPVDDLAANQVSKWRLRDLLEQMQEAMRSLNDLYRHYEEQEETLSEEVELLRAQLLVKQQQRAIHKLDKENLNTTIQIKLQDKRKLDSRLQALQQFQDQYRKHYTTLQDVLQSAFWKQVEERLPAKIVPGQGWGHKTVSQVWLESQKWESQSQGLEQRAVPVVRPTAVIYEYYVFFVVCGIFERMGFTHSEEDAALASGRTVSLDGLEDGASMRYTNGKVDVRITFNELIESDTENASRNGTHFYSSEIKRKPDIRLDVFRADTGEYLLCSMVVEVKYRPLYNIYHAKGNTEAMLQLGKYWAISYVDDQMDYHHNVVRQVVCVYPGDDRAKVKERSPQGLFMQLYPAGGDEIVGSAELQEEIEKWLAKTQ